MKTSNRKHPRRMFTLSWMALAVLLGSAALAWACTPTPQLQAIVPLAGPGGTELNIAGASFGTNPIPVEIRWNSTEGPVIAASQSAKDFSLTGRVPEGVAPGVYAVVAVFKNPDGTISNKAAQPFEVTSSSAGTGSRSAAADLWSGLSQGSSLQASDAAPAPSTGASGLGTSLVAVGVVALAAASAGLVVSRRRKRSSAHTTG